jgi:hypothetical protein
MLLKALMIAGVEMVPGYPFAIRYLDKSCRKLTSLALPSVEKRKGSYGAMPALFPRSGNASKRF